MTTFIRNAWYVAAWSKEIGRSLFKRRILGEPVVLYRKQDGTAAALLDRCAHKLVPLSTVGINTYDGDDYYVAFGALSARSSDEDIALEVAMLFRNVEVFLDAFEEHLDLGGAA